MYFVYQNQGQEPRMLRVKSLNSFTICHKWRKFITDLSGAIKAVTLKLGTHMDSRLLYSEYENQGHGPITFWVKSHPLIGFYEFPLMKNVCRTFLKNCKGNKIETWWHMERGLMYHACRNQGKDPYRSEINPLDRFYVAMLPCPTVMYLVSIDVSDKHELKYFKPMGISPLIALQRGYSQILWQL